MHPVEPIIGTLYVVSTSIMREKKKPDTSEPSAEIR